MVDCYLGEIRLFAGTRYPSGWLPCDGRELKISDFPILYSVIGTTYGGDGRTTFGLPDLRGRLPVGSGSGPGLSARQLGEMFGDEQVTLSVAEMPSHTHGLQASTEPAEYTSPSGAILAQVPLDGIFYRSENSTGFVSAKMNSDAVNQSGAGIAHPNMMPWIGLTYIIATNGNFPTETEDGDDTVEPSDLETDAFVGEIRAFPFVFAPDGWLACDGNEHPVANEELQDLYAVIGNTFGGTYGVTFATPNLMGRVAVGAGHGPNLTLRRVGDTGGDPVVALTEEQLPPHQHSMLFSYGPTRDVETQTPGSTSMPSFLGTPNAAAAYDPGPSDTHLHPEALTDTGGTDTSDAAPHENRQPFLSIPFYINYDGAYPKPAAEEG